MLAMRSIAFLLPAEQPHPGGRHQPPPHGRGEAGRDGQIPETYLRSILLRALRQKAGFSRVATWTQPFPVAKRAGLAAPLLEQEAASSAEPSRTAMSPAISLALWFGKELRRDKGILNLFGSSNDLHPSCPLYKAGYHSGPARFFVCPDTRIHQPRKMNRANPEKSRLG